MSPRKWRPRAAEKACTWPHADWSPEDERALRAVIAQYRPTINRAALYYSAHERQLALDLRQEAFILLWCTGAAKIATMTESYVNGMIYKRMERKLIEEARRSAGARHAMEEIGLLPRPELMDGNRRTLSRAAVALAAS